MGHNRGHSEIQLESIIYVPLRIYTAAYIYFNGPVPINYAAFTLEIEKSAAPFDKWVAVEP